MRTFFIGLKDKLLILLENEGEFQISERLISKQINCLEINPLHPKEIYCGTNGEGLWKSADGGVTWNRISALKTETDEEAATIITSSIITSMGIKIKDSANKKVVLYVGTEPSMLFSSEDNGITWEENKGIQTMPSKAHWAFPPRPSTHFIRYITPSETNEKHVALSIEAGAVLNTYDEGKSWNDRPKESPIDVHTLLMHPKAPGRIYAANGDGVSNPHKAYAESEDEGLSWEYKSNGLEKHPYLYHMVLHPDNPSDCFVSASKNASVAHGSNRYSTVYRKIRDAYWVEFSEGLPKENAYTHHLAQDPLKAGAFYALNNFGLYKLDEGADKWRKIPVSLEKKIHSRPYCFRVYS